MIAPKPGVYVVTPTPFDDQEELDEASFEQLMRRLATTGVDGVIILGVLGEAAKLYGDERDRLIKAAVESAAGEMTVIVGVSHPSAEGTRVLAGRAAALGADGVMVSPPRVSRSDPGIVLEYLRRSVRNCEIPVLLQDHPASSGTYMTAETITRAAEELSVIRWVKVEDPPSQRKICELRIASGDRLLLLGGLGALSLLDELHAGADGTMTGFSVPEALVAICRDFAVGDFAGAAATFAHWLPLIVTESQEEVGLAIRKWIYHRRGWLSSPVCRTPSWPMPDEVRRRVDTQLADLGIMGTADPGIMGTNAPG